MNVRSSTYILLIISFTASSCIPAKCGTLWSPTNGPPGGKFGIIKINPENPDLMYIGSGYTFYKTINSGDSWIRVDDLHRMSQTEELGVQAIEFDPTNPNVIYVGTRGGMFKSTDNGETWTSKTNERIARTVHNIAIDPTNTDIIYIVTSHGESVQNFYKSMNGGNTWTQLTSRLPDRYRINSLIVTNHDELLIGTGTQGDPSTHIYRSKDGGMNWQQLSVGQGSDTHVAIIRIDPHDNSHIYIGFADNYNRGRKLHEVLIESKDGGDTWSPVHGGGVGSAVSDLVFSTSNPDIIYYQSPLHRSRDGGRTWEKVYTWNWVEDFGRVEQTTIAIHPENENILFSTLMGQGIAKSIDGGETWWLSNEGVCSSFITNLAASPTDPETLYASGGDGSGTWKTTDGGETWSILNKNGISHPWVDELTIVPTDPEKVYDIADVGLIFRTENGGESWSTINNGFHFSSVYALAIDPGNPRKIYASNNGFGIFRSDEGGDRWRYLLASPDYTYTIAIDPENPDIIYSGHNKKFFETSTYVYRSLNAGEGWEAVLKINGSDAVTSVAIDPQNTNRVYAATVGEEGEIYFTNNRGETWEKLNDNFTMCTVWGQPQLLIDPYHPSTAYAATWLAGTWKTTNAGKNWTLLKEAPISATALSINRDDPNTLFLADRSSPTVWKSTDGGTKWKKVANFAKDGALLVMSVFTDGDTVYTSTFYPSLRGGKLYKSTDGGLTWSDITGTLPPGILDIAVDPHNSNLVYLTTNINGAYKSIDGGETWTRIENFPDVGAYDIEIDSNVPGTLYVAARGGSLPSWFTQTAGITEGISFSDSAGVYKSTDYGETWSSLLATSVSCRVIRRHPDNTNLLFCTDLLDGVQMSVDGGRSWRRLKEGLGNSVVTSIAVNGDKIYAGTQGCGVYSGDLDTETGEVMWRPSRSNKPVPKVYNMRIEVDPTNSENIFVMSYPGGLFASPDGGKTFQDRNGITPSIPLEDPLRQYYSFAIDPNNPSKMWVGTWGGGIYKSYNSMILNIPMNLYGKHINKILVDPKDSNTVIVASEEGVYITRDDGRSWEDISKGLITKSIATLAIDTYGNLYAGSKGYGVFYLEHNRDTWRQLTHVQQFGVRWEVWERPMYLYNALLINPFDPDIMYLGTFPTGFFRTTDGGMTWHEINTNFTIDGAFSMAFHPYNKRTIFAGTYNGVSKTQDAGETWVKCSNGMPPELWVFSIVVDPLNPDIIYAAAKNGQNKGTGRPGFLGTVLKTVDGGRNWYQITNGLNTNQEYYQLVMYPNNYDILFVSASSGVYMTRNAGASWEPIFDGLFTSDDVMVQSGATNNVANNLVISSDAKYLYYGTQGRGVYKGELSVLGLEPNPDALPETCFNYVQDGDETGIDTGGRCIPSDGEYDYGLIKKETHIDDEIKHVSDQSETEASPEETSISPQENIVTELESEPESEKPFSIFPHFSLITVLLLFILLWKHNKPSSC